MRWNEKLSHKWLTTLLHNINTHTDAIAEIVTLTICWGRNCLWRAWNTRSYRPTALYSHSFAIVRFIGDAHTQHTSTVSLTIPLWKLNSNQISIWKERKKKHLAPFTILFPLLIDFESFSTVSWFFLFKNGQNFQFVEKNVKVNSNFI